MRAKIVNGQFMVTLTTKEATRLGVSQNVVPSAPAERTWASVKERKAGNGFACTVPGEDCGRRDLRTPNRAAIHGIDAGGHSPR